jgi:hypothetical protein
MQLPEFPPLGPSTLADVRDEVAKGFDSAGAHRSVTTALRNQRPVCRWDKPVLESQIPRAAGGVSCPSELGKNAVRFVECEQH